MKRIDVFSAFQGAIESKERVDEKAWDDALEEAHELSNDDCAFFCGNQFNSPILKELWDNKEFSNDYFSFQYFKRIFVYLSEENVNGSSSSLKETLRELYFFKLALQEPDVYASCIEARKSGNDLAHAYGIYREAVEKRVELEREAEDDEDFGIGLQGIIDKG